MIVRILIKNNYFKKLNIKSLKFMVLNYYLISMELICDLGRGCEFWIEKLNKVQTDFVIKNAEN